MSILLSKENDIVVQGVVACAKVLNFSLESVEQSLKLVKLRLHFSVLCCHLGVETDFINSFIL